MPIRPRESLPLSPTHLEPARIEEELQQGEDGHAQVQVVAFVALSWVQELATDEAGQEVAVHSDGHHLGAGWVTRSGFSRSQEVLERPGLGWGITDMGSQLALSLPLRPVRQSVRCRI